MYIDKWRSHNFIVIVVLSNKICHQVYLTCAAPIKCFDFCGIYVFCEEQNWVFISVQLAKLGMAHGNCGHVLVWQWSLSLLKHLQYTYL